MVSPTGFDDLCSRSKLQRQRFVIEKVADIFTSGQIAAGDRAHLEYRPMGF
jgi:hypothetical protein